MEQRLQIYKPLSTGESKIRILTLNAPTEDGQLQCSTQMISLEPEPRIPYTGLSYVWGDPSVTEDIIVDGVLFPMTANLALALWHIWKCFGVTVLWVDAICKAPPSQNSDPNQ